MLGNCGDARGHEGKKVGDTQGCQENSGGCQGNRRGCKGNDGNVKDRNNGGNVNEMMVDGEMAKDDLAHHSLVTPMFR